MTKSPAGVIKECLQGVSAAQSPCSVCQGVYACVYMCVCRLECTDGQTDLAVYHNLKVLGVRWSVSAHCAGHHGRYGLKNPKDNYKNNKQPNTLDTLQQVNKPLT